MAASYTPMVVNPDYLLKLVPPDEIASITDAHKARAYAMYSEEAYPARMVIRRRQPLCLAV